MGAPLSTPNAKANELLGRRVALGECVLTLRGGGGGGVWWSAAPPPLLPSEACRAVVSCLYVCWRLCVALAVRHGCGCERVCRRGVVVSAWGCCACMQWSCACMLLFL